MPIELIGTIAAAIVIVAIAAGLTARAGRVRPLIIGLGLAAIPIGLYLTGLLRLTINGVVSLVDWFQRTVFTEPVAWGLGLLIGGVALAVVGGVLPKKPARERTAVPAREVPVRKGKQAPVAAEPKPGVPAQPAAASPAATPTPAAKPAPKGLSSEDAEVEDLLRKRGIM